MQVWLFPGHGSQYPGMGRWCRTDAGAEEIFDAAESLSGLPLRRVMAGGPIADLTRPEMLEPALVALQIAHIERLWRHDIRPDAVAGYSVGEVAALFAAGVLSRYDALRIAAARGRLLQTLADRGSWRMASVSRIDCGGLTSAIDRVSHDGSVAIGAFNAPDHVTITGLDSAVRRVEAHAVARGAACAHIDVAGPWHSMIARDVGMAVGALLAAVPFRQPGVPVWMGTTGAREDSPADCRTALGEQIWRPVLWTDVMTSLWTAGVRRAVEIGPGHTLTGFVRRTWPPGRHTAGFLERENGRPIDVADLVRVRDRAQPAAVVA